MYSAHMNRYAPRVYDTSMMAIEFLNNLPVYRRRIIKLKGV